MLCALLNLHGDIAVVFEIFCEPNRGKMTPAELLDDHVSIEENFPDVNGVIPSDFIVRHAFVLAGIGILKEALPNLVLQWCEILIRFIHSCSRCCLRVLATAVIVSGLFI